MMKYCPRVYNYLYLDNPEGDIWLCQWMTQDKGRIGNLLEGDVETYYNSEYCAELRGSIKDQSFRYCRFEACPFLQNNDLEEVTPEEYESREKEVYFPTEINMAYDFICNQHCETCRKEVFIPSKDYESKMNLIQKRLSPYLDRASYISTCGHGDLFASKYMMSVLENLHPRNPNIRFLLETNGVLFDEEHWARIQHLKDFYLEVVVTINSFDKFTYEHVSRGGNYDKLMHNLAFMSDLRKKNYLNILTQSLVIQDRNFREIPSFIERSFRDYSFDSVVLKPVYQWGTMDDDVYWYKDVLNPMHPYHEEYLEILKHPALHDPRVYNFGGETSHEARPFPGSSCQDGQRIAELERCVAEKQCEIDNLQCELERARAQGSGAEDAMRDQERRIQALRAKIDGELRGLCQQLEDIQNSRSFKIGRAVTYLPRKVRDAGKGAQG